MHASTYLSTAYSSARLAEQEPARKRSAFKRMTGRRLSWGKTQAVIPQNFLRPSPERLRFWEKETKRRDQQKAEGVYKPSRFEHIDFHDRCDQERYRYAPWGKAAHFWIYLATFGKGGFFLFAIMSVAVGLFVAVREPSDFLTLFFDAFLILFRNLAVPCLAAWAFASLIVYKFPRLWARPAKGPKWELNRRTGMITVFKHKGGVASEQRAPFPEFDAYINTSPDRQGLPMNVLSIEHRYSDLSIYFGDLQPPDRNTHQACALWDFIQNYMDISHPLPDAPLFEEHRHKDPTTAEHDKATGRYPRYWIDMDDETFKQVKRDMWTRVAMIDTFSRPNLMARYVDYSS